MVRREGGIDNYRLFSYTADFAENWLKGVYMCQDKICEILSQSAHPSKLMIKNPNALY